MPIHNEPVLFNMLAAWFNRMRREGVFDETNELYRDVQRAALFWFPNPAHDSGLKDMLGDEDRAAWLSEHLYLPFPVVAIEDPGTLTVLRDNPVNDRETLRGVGVQRAFLDLMPVGRDLIDHRGFRDALPEAALVSGKSFLLTSGMVTLEEVTPTETKLSGYVSTAVAVTPGELLSTKIADRRGVNTDLVDFIQPFTLTNVNQTMQELCVLCDPAKFILETTPAAAEKPNPYPKRKAWKEREQRIRRVEERPVYTVLKPHEIRKAMALPEPEHDPLTNRGSPRPHERRAHVRRLMAERFTHKKGKVVHVRSSWIGPSESQSQGKRYRVLLDH